jgi:predicted ATPase with chaperone activity
VAERTLQDILRSPKKVEDTGLSRGVLIDLALKCIYFGGYVRGMDISKTLCLPFADVTEAIIDFLKDEKFLEVRGGQDFGKATMEYSLTARGREKAAEAMERNTYVGAAPVPFERYVEAVGFQGIREVTITQEQMRHTMGDLIINPRVFSLLGPAANSGKSAFLFGKPGNGKTSVAERLAKCLGGHVWIPQCVEVDGHIIKVYDRIVHEVIESDVDQNDVAAVVRSQGMDQRWLKTKRPFVMVGGELTLENLDLIYHQHSKFYEAPFQMKSNCGIFLIDDFGRQQCRPQDLLNRWIVPLEKRVDFLTLHTGKKIEVPFDQLILFSTNLEPKDLVDEAFLRRISFKIGFDSPTYEEFAKIFEKMCGIKKIDYTEDAVKYIWKRQFDELKFEPRAVHPRDVLAQIESIAKYYGVKPKLSKELIDRACDSYFVKLTSL